MERGKETQKQLSEYMDFKRRNVRGSHSGNTSKIQNSVMAAVSTSTQK
jgi:hypothetical protein